MPVKIELQDETTFIWMMRTRRPFEHEEKGEITDFLRGTGLTLNFIQNNVWGGSAQNVAEKVFHIATDHGYPLVPQRAGYTVLGGIVDAYLDRELVGREWALYITSFALYYQLVEWSSAILREKLEDLLRVIVEYMCTGVHNAVVKDVYAAQNDTRIPPPNLPGLMKRVTELLRAVPPEQWEELQRILS